MSIPRKPLPVKTETYDATTSPKPLAYHYDTTPPSDPNDNKHSHSVTSPPQSTLPPAAPYHRSYVSATKHKLSLLRRRTKVILIVATACLLILIIGLAAGLATRQKAQNLPLPSKHGGPYRGDLTYYASGLGACGLDSKDGDRIVAVSHLLFDAVSTGSDPNQNPLCGKMIRARRSDRSVDLRVVDRCTGCQPRDLDVTEKVFAGLASVEDGRVGVEWAWLEDVPGSAAG